MATARYPSSILTNIHTKDVAGMAAQRLRQRPIICRKYVDVLVKSARHEEGTGFPRCHFLLDAIFHFRIGLSSDAGISTFEPSEIRNVSVVSPNSTNVPYSSDIPALHPSVSRA